MWIGYLFFNGAPTSFPALLDLLEVAPECCLDDTCEGRDTTPIRFRDVSLASHTVISEDNYCACLYGCGGTWSASKTCNLLVSRTITPISPAVHFQTSAWPQIAAMFEHGKWFVFVIQAARPTETGESRPPPLSRPQARVGRMSRPITVLIPCSY